MFTSPGDHSPSVPLLYLPRKLLVDIGFGSLLDKLDEYWGKPPTLVLTVMAGLAAFAYSLRLFIEVLIWAFRAISTGGESLGLMNLQDWAALAITIGIAIAAVFVGFVILDRLWISKSVAATRHDVERMLHKAEASQQRTEDKTRAMMNEIEVHQVAIMERLRRLDDR